MFPSSVSDYRPARFSGLTFRVDQRNLDFRKYVEQLEPLIQSEIDELEHLGYDIDVYFKTEQKSGTNRFQKKLKAQIVPHNKSKAIRICSHEGDIRNNGVLERVVEEIQRMCATFQNTLRGSAQASSINNQKIQKLASVGDKLYNALIVSIVKNGLTLNEHYLGDHLNRAHRNEHYTSYYMSNHTQGMLLSALQSEFRLDDQEQALIDRCRFLKLSDRDNEFRYRKGTTLEVLLAYWEKNDKKRYQQVITWIAQELTEPLTFQQCNNHSNFFNETGISQADFCRAS